MLERLVRLKLNFYSEGSMIKRITGSEVEKTWI